MPVREFRDESGRWWTAWDVKPEEIHPVTKAEDYLADSYITGWIVFETFSGDEKRRLSPWPMRWTLESEMGLRGLLERADPVPPRKLRAAQAPMGESSSASDREVAEGHDKPDVTDLGVVRTFRYPGGRIWTVCVVAHPEDGGTPVLRFSSGQRSIDLRSWRRAWTDEPDDKLAVLLRQAAPRHPPAQLDPDTPRRRWNDHEQPQAS